MYLLDLPQSARNPYRGSGGWHRTPEESRATEERKKARREEVLAYFLSLPDPTLKLCGAHFGVTRERIRQILSADPETQAQAKKKKAQAALAHYATKSCHYCGKEIWRKDNIISFHSEYWFCNRTCTMKARGFAFLGTPPTKRCPRCNTEKPREDFTTRTDKRYVSSYCRPCLREYVNTWAKNHPERHLETTRRAVAKYYAKKMASLDPIIHAAMQELNG
jgi:hypothetical protein